MPKKWQAMIGNVAGSKLRGSVSAPLHSAQLEQRAGDVLEFTYSILLDWMCRRMHEFEPAVVGRRGGLFVEGDRGHQAASGAGA